eukprot:11231486-Alexandrium_andersonii.AAC.1
MPVNHAPREPTRTGGEHAKGERIRPRGPVAQAPKQRQGQQNNLQKENIEQEDGYASRAPNAQQG